MEGTAKVDLGQLATTHLGIGVGSHLLEDLCATLLGQLLSKGNVRMSKEQVLSDDQACQGCDRPSPRVSCLRSFFLLFVRAYGQSTDMDGSVIIILRATLLR